MYNLHEECLVVAEDIEDLVLKLGCEWERVGGQDNAKVSEKQALEVAELLAQVDKWIEVDQSGVDWVEPAKVETAVGNYRQRHSGNVAGTRRGVRIDWT